MKIYLPIDDNPIIVQKKVTDPQLIAAYWAVVRYPYVLLSQVNSTKLSNMLGVYIYDPSQQSLLPSDTLISFTLTNPHAILDAANKPNV